MKKDWVRNYKLEFLSALAISLNQGENVVTKIWGKMISHNSELIQQKFLQSLFSISNFKISKLI